MHVESSYMPRDIVMLSSFIPFIDTLQRRLRTASQYRPHRILGVECGLFLQTD